MVIRRASKDVQVDHEALNAAVTAALRTAIHTPALSQAPKAYVYEGEQDAYVEEAYEPPNGRISGKFFALAAAAAAAIGAWALGDNYFKSRARRARRIMLAQVRVEHRQRQLAHSNVIPMQQHMLRRTR